MRAALILILLTTPVMAADVSALWDQTGIENVDGWYIYYADTSGAYVPGQRIDASAAVCVDPEADGTWECSFTDTYPNFQRLFAVVASYNGFGESAGVEAYIDLASPPTPGPPQMLIIPPPSADADYQELEREGE